MKIIINGESGCDMPTYTVDLSNCVTPNSIRDAIYQALLLEGYGNNQVDDIMNITKDADIETKIPYGKQTVTFREKKDPLPITYDFFPPEENSVESDKDKQEEIKELYFAFYDQMDEPERSVALKKWSYGKSLNYTSPRNIYDAINYGCDMSNLYMSFILKKYANK